MTLDEIKAAVAARSPYPVLAIEEDSGAIMVVLGTQTPDGLDTHTSFALSRALLESSDQPIKLLDGITDKAVDSLKRYTDSFKPPTWDETQWGP